MRSSHTIDRSLVVGIPLPGLAFAQEGPSTADLSLAMDTMWVIIAACLVLFMQAGFAMLEVGFSRMKNVGSVVAKILVNLAIAALLFWAVGFALAFGTGNANRHAWLVPRRLARTVTTSTPDLLDAGPALRPVPLPGPLRGSPGHRVGHERAGQFSFYVIFLSSSPGYLPDWGTLIWGGGG